MKNELKNKLNEKDDYERDLKLHFQDFRILLLETENALLREEVALDDKILAERQRLLEAIPPCELHDSLCIPHALEWIADRIAESNRAG